MIFVKYFYKREIINKIIVQNFNNVNIKNFLALL